MRQYYARRVARGSKFGIVRETRAASEFETLHQGSAAELHSRQLGIGSDRSFIDVGSRSAIRRRQGPEPHVLLDRSDAVLVAANAQPT